jgi:hypothetical protein
MQNPQWMDLTINDLNVNQTIYSDNLRHILAKQNELAEDHYKIDEKVFHHSDGHPNTSTYPFFRIFANGKTGHVYAVGEEAVEYLQANAHKISRMISMFLGQPVPEHRYSGVYQLHMIPYLLDYYIPTMVINNSAKVFSKIKDDLKKNILTTKIIQMVEDKIRKDILDHTVIMNTPVAEDFTLGDLKIEKIMGMPVKKGQCNRTVVLAKNVQFRAGLKIEGIIHVGHLKSRGYGLVRRDFKRDKK